VITLADRLIPAVEPGSPGRSAGRLPSRAVSRDFFTLTKPNVMTLLLLTTLCAMLVAARGIPPLGTLVWTLVGGALAAGGAAALNHYLDRDIDGLMSRTSRRPLPNGRIDASHAAIFGICLSVLSVYVLAVFVNPLAALLSLSGNLFYVFVYTRWLKRRTPQNIVIGGAAGAVPPLVGWAAVTGGMGTPALLMFAVVFAWTPPHFWSLALFKRGDYQAAGVPMLPAVRGDAVTRRQILAYTVVLVLASVLFVPLGALGWFYLLAALSLGGIFLIKSIRLVRRPGEQRERARALFFYSLWYLAGIFLAMVIDSLVGRVVSV
jgi:protoheme IX farnesyltransferase